MSVRSRRIFAGALGCAAVIALLQPNTPPSASAAGQQRPSALRPLLETALWKIEVSTISTYSEAGKPADFDRAIFAAVGRGSALELEGRSTERSYTMLSTLPRPSVVFDGQATYSFAASNTTDVRVTCKTSTAAFTASGAGRGKLEVAFRDGAHPGSLATIAGAASFLTLSAGTGFSRGAIGFKVSGDLEYDEAAGVAESVGDDAANVQGTVSLPGLELSYTPHVGAGTVPNAVAKDSTATIEAARTFQFKVQNYFSSTMKADDSLIGAATAEVSANVRHDATVLGTQCRDDARSKVAIMSLRIKTQPARKPRSGLDTIAFMKVVEQDTKTGATSTRESAIGSGESVFTRTEKTRLVHTGWGPPARDWYVGHSTKSVGGGGAGTLPAATPERRRLGVKPGSSAAYTVASRRAPLSALKTLTFKVARADPKTGRVILNGAVTFRDGRRDSTAMPLDVFSGHGGIRGILVPARLDVGERVYGVGKVVAVRGGEVTVEYRSRGARIVGVYDRETGWLREMKGGNQSRPEFTLTRGRSQVSG